MVPRIVRREATARRRRPVAFDLDDDRPKSIGRLRGFQGNYGCFVRSYAYIRSLGAEGLRDASETAVLNANYLLARLRELGVAEHLPLAFGELCMHEFVLSGAPMKRDLKIRTLDLAKRLLDHGFHPPTVYFPLLVDEALLVEPTETETRETLDAFAEALAAILREAAEDPEIARNAPYTTPVRRLDEAAAAKRPVIRQPLERGAVGRLSDRGVVRRAWAAPAGGAGSAGVTRGGASGAGATPTDRVRLPDRTAQRDAARGVIEHAPAVSSRADHVELAAECGSPRGRLDRLVPSATRSARGTTHASPTRRPPVARQPPAASAARLGRPDRLPADGPRSTARTPSEARLGESFTALAPRTALTTRASRGRVTRSATRPSALHVPTQRVQVEQLADRVAQPRPRGRRSPSGRSSTNGSRTQASTFSLATSFEARTSRRRAGRISAGADGPSPLSRAATSSVPRAAPQPALRAA